MGIVNTASHGNGYDVILPAGNEQICHPGNEDLHHRERSAKSTKAKGTQTGYEKRSVQTDTSSLITTLNSQTQTHPTHDYITAIERLFSDFETMEKFSALLDEHSQVEKFKKLVNALTLRTLSPHNLSWKTALDMGVLSMCQSTTNMRYDKDCVEFFSLFNLMFGSSAINVLRGTAHFGSVVDNTAQKGKFQPGLANYNFPIPSVNTLRNMSAHYKKEVQVGFIPQSLEIAQEQAAQGAQYVVGLDGKMVAQGCKNESDGDVNLWGREKPTIASSVAQLQIRTQSTDDINFSSSADRMDEHQICFRRLALHISRTLKQLHYRIKHSFYQRQRLVTLSKENPDNVSRYNTRMSFLHQNTSDCESVLKQGIDLQTDVLQALRLLGSWPYLEDIPTELNLSTFPNCFQLLPPDKIDPSVDLQDPSNYKYIKQGTVEWHSVRKKARVTGSTLYKAVGLDTLQRQKEHHYTVVCGRSESAPDTLLQKRLAHGRENEVNIIATIVSSIMPAFLPNCYAYFEVGPVILDRREGTVKVEVSADGVIRCPNGTDCANYPQHHDRKIVVEMKSPYPTKENPHITVHEVPLRYVTQILCECEAWDCEEAWLLVGTPSTTTAFRCYRDSPTLEKILATADVLYGPVKPCVPTRLHAATSTNREHLKKYISTHTSLFLECPSRQGIYGEVVPSTEIISPYGVTPNHNFQPVSHTDIDFQVVVCENEGKRFFNAAHTVLRNQASEVLVFMATNKDRIQTDSTPYSFPIAYAMKGSSMSNDDLRYMMSLLQEELGKRSIPVLCQVFDGQWHNYITHDAQGKCLTKLSWRHKWQEVSGFSKNKCVDEMVQGCRIKPGDAELLGISERLESGQECTFGNVVIQCAITVVSEKETIKTLTISSTGGVNFKTPVLHQIVSVCKHSRPDMFVDEIGYSTCHPYSDPPGTPQMPVVDVNVDDAAPETIQDDHTYCSQRTVDSTVTGKKNVKRKKIVGMDEGDTNMLHLLSGNVVGPIIEDIDETDTSEQITSSELLIYVLLDARCLLLNDILTQLQYCDAGKWGHMTKTDMFPGLLDEFESLSAQCTLKDLKIILKTLEHHTDRVWYECAMVKKSQVNRIVNAFGGEECLVGSKSRKKKQTFNPPTLRIASKQVIMREDYKVENLQIALGTVLAREFRSEWFRNATLDPVVCVPYEDEESNESQVECVELFSYPELNERKEMVFKTFDYTHILTNMRSHVLNRGYEYCKREDFEWIIDNTTGVLSRYLVQYNMDSQNAFSAMKLFGDEVILTLESNGRKDSVEFLKLVKGWHMACDERGIPADVRVRALANMHKFLTNDINFWSVPFQHPGRYIRGMTWQTFEAILQCISTRIELYGYAQDGTYNTRSVSTLANESFFADLVRLDKEGKGYPKASNIGQVMGRVVMLNHFKHKRDKVYFLAPTLKPKYPPHLADEDTERISNENLDNFNGIYRDHYFDLKDTHKSQRCRREDITTGLQALRGVNGVRAYFKVNESRILPEIRAGNKPKGFTLD